MVDLRRFYMKMAGGAGVIFIFRCDHLGMTVIGIIEDALGMETGVDRIHLRCYIISVMRKAFSTSSMRWSGIFPAKLGCLVTGSRNLE